MLMFGIVLCVGVAMYLFIKRKYWIKLAIDVD
jgi:hypothetical protein